MRALTVSQLKTLRFIRSFILANGASPSVREICSGMGWESTNATADAVSILVRDEYLLQWEEGRSRNLRLTELGWRAGWSPTEIPDEVQRLQEQIAQLQERIRFLTKG